MFMFWICWTLILLLWDNSVLQVNAVLDVSRSWFRIPDGTTWSMTHSLSIPFAKITTITANIPITYTFDNTSRLVLSEGGRSLEDEQLDLFDAIEESLRSFGLDGKSCLLRAICEINESPMRDLTLIGEILTLVLTPRRNLADRSFLLEYLKAEDIGRRKGNCWKIYYSCPFSVRHFLESMRYERR